MFTQFGKSINMWLLTFTFKILHCYFLRCSIISSNTLEEVSSFKSTPSQGFSISTGAGRGGTTGEDFTQPWTPLANHHKSLLLLLQAGSSSAPVIRPYPYYGPKTFSLPFPTTALNHLGKTRVESLMTHLNPPKIPVNTKNAPRLFHRQHGTAATEREGSKK